MTNPISDPTINILEQALGGLSQRQSVIGSNVANAETPGYQALSVSFENQLSQALNGTGLPLTTTHTGHMAAPASVSHGPVVKPRLNSISRLDGNNVDIDLEMSQLAETSIQYQSLTQIATNQLALLKAIASDK